MEHFDREETPVEFESHQQPRCGMTPNIKGATDANEGCGDASEGCTDASDGAAATHVNDTQLLRHISDLLSQQCDEVRLHVDQCFKHQGQAVEALLLQRSPSKHSAKAGDCQGFSEQSSNLRHAASVEFDGVEVIERLESVESYQDIQKKEPKDMLGRLSESSFIVSSVAEANKRATIDSQAGYKRTTIETGVMYTSSMKEMDSIKEMRSNRATQRRISNLEQQLKEAAAKQDETPSEMVRVIGESSRRQSIWQAFRVKTQAFVSHAVFETFTFVIIFTNVLIVGVQVDYMATSHDEGVSDVFYIIDCVYTLLFLFELLCRMIAEGTSFFYSKNWAWNWFDFMIVASSVVETIFSLLETTGGVDMSHFRVIRVIRITRLLRTFRMVRLVRFIRALRTLLYSIMATMKSVVWALLLLLMIFYGFGVAFTQAVSEYNIGRENLPDIGDADCGPDAVFCSLLTFWGTLPRAMFTLFKAISGGVSWDSVVEPLALVGWVWVGVFVGFIAFTFLAVLNVVTGVFCQSAIESAQQDKDIATMQLMASRGAFIDTIKKLFVDMDADLSGAISIREFEQFVKDERVQAYFSTLEIDASDIWSLFKLMDSDQTGNIDLEEFIGGCLQLRGQAKAIQIAKMSYDNSLVRKMLVEFMDSVDDRLDRLLLWAGIDLFPPEDSEEEEEEEGEDVQDGTRHSDSSEPARSHDMQGGPRHSLGTELDRSQNMQGGPRQSVGTELDRSYNIRGSTSHSAKTSLRFTSETSAGSGVVNQSKSHRTHAQKEAAARQAPFRRAYTRHPGVSRASKASGHTLGSYPLSATMNGKVSNEEDRQALAGSEHVEFSRSTAPDKELARDITL